jgi:LCP family protein required for cell wall assembly
MSKYRVYRVGEEAPVRSAPAPSVAAPPLSRRERSDGPSESRRSLLLTALVVVAVGVGLALSWSFGREALGNAVGVFDLVEQSGRIPAWVLYGVPALGVLVVIGVTAYLAFGRHLSLKVLGLAVVVAALAAPGFALGWTNGVVSTVGDRTEEVEAEVVETTKEMEPPLPRKPVNILLIGIDQQVEGDPGRSDTQLLVRLDPDSKSISMLSLPRDLRVEIPGYGLAKINEAYTYGGPALTVKTFTSVTGIPINHFIRIDFSGFWHSIDILDGVYVPVDHRYYNPPSSSWKSINLEPGYQKLMNRQALDFVRFRHDQKGDFTRMQRQQLFLRELQRQSSRWNTDWKKVVKLLKAVAAETTSDLDSLKRLLPLANLALTLDTSRISTVHVEGDTPMIDGVSYVVASEEEIAAKVAAFENPLYKPAKATRQVPKRQYRVRVFNANGYAGMAGSTASQLKALGYRAAAVGDADEPVATTVIYAPEYLGSAAEGLARLLAPAEVRTVPRSPGTDGHVHVFVGTSFDGLLDVPVEQTEPEPEILEDQRYLWTEWQAFDAETPLKLEAPTSWYPGLGYDEFHDYAVETTEGKKKAAAIVVGTTPEGGYWGIQAMRWADPPAIANPSSTKVIDGRKYLFFYEGEALRMVAWRRSGTVYWVVNTLENQLPEEVMLALATSCTRVTP